MIYTVTLNPALDYILWTENMETGKINRTTDEKIYPGGKGINVSVVLKSLGFDSTALGFCAGFTGNEIIRLLDRYGCRADFIETESGLSRINVKIKSRDETEINGMGPRVYEKELDLFMKKINLMQSGDFLILAGSVPSSLPKDLYKKILTSVSDRDIYAVVDAEGELLKSTLPCRPFLIKPNLHELCGIFGREIKTNAEIISAAKELQRAGARNVLVSLAGDGAILVSEEETVFHSPAHKGKVINSVGAGDSMVAGFIAGFISTGDYKKSLDLGIASGSASAFNEWLASKEDILGLYNI